MSGVEEHDVQGEGFDPNAYRKASAQAWEDIAPGWSSYAQQVGEWFRPVTERMLDAAQLAPGKDVLELAAGAGELGLLAAQRVAPTGHVIISDWAERMLEGARARAEELGVSNVELRPLNAESIDLDVASVDVVLCRLGYMLLVSPEAGFADTRRVLRPEGRVALTVWGTPQENPWASLLGVAMVARGFGAPPVPGAPGPFALGDSDKLSGSLTDAGFLDVQVEPVDLPRRVASFEEFWQSALDLSPSFADALRGVPEEDAAGIQEDVRAAMRAYASADGSLSIPARALVATASA